MFDIDELKIYRGDDIRITDKIIVTGDSAGAFLAAYIAALCFNDGLNEELHVPAVNIAIAGLVVENGEFDYLNGRFPQFETFYQDYKNFIDPEKLKKELFTKRLRIRYLTDMGAHLPPQSAFYVMQGMETLSLRLDRHTYNAQKIAEFLESHPKVEQVSYPGLASSKYHALAEKYFPKGAGAILAVNIKGGREGALKVLEHVRIFGYMVNVGDAKSLIVHPASSTHFGQTPEQRAKAGIYDNTLRLSVGIEDAEDLIRDLEQALSYV